jgi:hypothetical protein
MANIKKSFNFRNGIQVDDDNFIVNSNGLVGIGSTIPTESLDVLGNIKLSGTLYAKEILGNIVNTSADGTGAFVRVNIGITSIKSGIISATSGIVTYYGDGSKLQGLPTSQWVDINPDINGYESIYAQGSVGIATTNPLYTFQVGGTTNINSFGNGVGIASEGDIIATRDVTIGRNLSVTGIATISTRLIVSGITSILSNLTVSGITTSYSFSGFGTNINGINASNISNGILHNDRIPTNISKPSGIATFNLFYGNLVGIATTARGLTTNANIDIISITSDYSDIGISTASIFNASTLIGIGTNNTNSDLHIRRIGSDAELQVTSDSNTSKIIIGKDVTLTNNNTIIQFNDTSISAHPQSGQNSFDIINYAPGNFNSFIRPGLIPNLKFNWINHSTNAILMSLTPDGNLGLGKTNPSQTFEVVGTSTITSNSFVGGNFSVSGSVTSGSLNITGSTTLKSATINGSVGVFANSPNYTLQIGSSLNALGTSGIGVGISSSGNIVASGIITASKFVGIGSDITSINPTNISSGTISNININSSSGVITTGILNATTISGSGSNITSINPTNISSGTISNININSLSGVITTGILSATTIYGDGSNITSLKPQNVQTGRFTGNYVFEQVIEINQLKISSGLGTYNAQIGISTEIDRYEINNYCRSIEYLISVQKSNKVQTSKVLISAAGTNFSYQTYQTTSYPSSIVSIGVTSLIQTISLEDYKYIVLELTPSETGLTTYKFSRHIL